MPSYDVLLPVVVTYEYLQCSTIHYETVPIVFQGRGGSRIFEKGEGPS